MIHIATVHWETNFFKEVQYKFIKKNLEEFKIWTFADKIPINEIDAEKDKKMYYFCEESGEWNHRIKLNNLANLIAKESSDDDVILFLDGDAWPIAPIGELIKNTLSEYPVGAVLRTENGERHAHPSFMFTKLSFWKDNNLNWKGGEINGKKYDVGYNTHVIRNKNLDWRKFRRTKGLTEHKVFFSIYGDIIYHHGAGFRNPISAYCKKEGIRMTKEDNISLMKKFIEQFSDI